MGRETCTEVTSLVEVYKEGQVFRLKAVGGYTSQWKYITQYISISHFLSIHKVVTV